MNEEQIKELISVIRHLGFNSHGKEPGTTERIAIELSDLNRSVMSVSNALNDLDVTFTRIMHSLETLQHNQTNK